MAEEKPREQHEMEQRAAALERKIVRFTNIDSESFTHSYRGISITVQPGESYIGRMPECDHLAKHLARKMLARSKKKASKDDSKGIQLWNDREITELKTKILSSIGEETLEEVSPEEERKRDQKRLEADYGKPELEDTPAFDASKITKGEIIKDLESRGLTVDHNKTKDQLMTELMEAEAQGITPDNPKT